MKKRALLVGAPGGITSRYLKGVEHDLRNMRTFLMSPQGGAWADEEILEYPDPTLNELNAVYDELHADYTLIYVSGDGSTDPFGRRMAHLSNGDTFCDTDFLKLESPRLLVIMDTARVHRGEEPKFMPVPHKISKGQLEFARENYNEWVADSKHGQLIIHATNAHNDAGDTNLGGVFTQTLLFFGYGLKPGDAECTFASIKRMGDIAINMVGKHENPQKPFIAYKKGNPRLPFSMGVPFTVPRRKSKKQHSAGGALLLGLFIAGLFMMGNDEE
jgi:hypothetical protein